MKKYVLSALAIIMTLFMLTGCGKKETPVDTNDGMDRVVLDSLYVDEEGNINVIPDEESEDADIQDATVNESVASFDQIETLVMDYTDTSGYVYEVTVKISPWILYTDSEVLQSAWNEVGSGKDLPTMDDWNFEKFTENTYRNSNVNFGARMTDTYYSVGSISFRNITEGFDFTSDHPGSCRYQFNWYSPNMMDLYGYGFMNMILYGNERSFGGMAIAVDAAMSSNNWGPVPFCLLHAENIVPNYPEGQYHQEMETGYLSFIKGIKAGYSAPGEGVYQYHIPFYDDIRGMQGDGNGLAAAATSSDATTNTELATSDYAYLCGYCNAAAEYTNDETAMADKFYELLMDKAPSDHPIRNIARSDLYAYIGGTYRDMEAIVMQYNGSAIVIFSGTHGIDDILTDIGIVADSSPAWLLSAVGNALYTISGTTAYEAERDLVRQITNNYDNVIVTGHSLGGHLAVDATLNIDGVTRCIAFDPPGRSDSMLQDAFNPEREAKIINYCADGSYVSRTGTQVGEVKTVTVRENYSGADGLTGLILTNHGIFEIAEALGGTWGREEISYTEIRQDIVLGAAAPENDVDSNEGEWEVFDQNANPVSDDRYNLSSFEHRTVKTSDEQGALVFQSEPFGSFMNDYQFWNGDDILVNVNWMESGYAIAYQDGVYGYVDAGYINW